MDLSSFAPLIILGVIVLFCKLFIAPLIEDAVKKKKQPSAPTKPRTRGLSELEVYPYVSCGSILTPTELKFFKALEPVIDGHWHIFTKVRLEDLIHVKAGLEKKTAYGYRGRIKSRHIDFVLCEKDTLEILMCIELDDSSHERKDRMERDTFVDKAVRDAGLTIIHIPVHQNYSEAYLRAQLFDTEDDSETTAQATTARESEVA